MGDSIWARPGSVAGASGDAGTQYRRGVAAYAAACGLAGVPLPELEIPPAHARVTSVSLETDDAVDDIRIDFESGWRALVQAKRSLRIGTPLNEAVGQWVHAAKAGLDPAKDRLVIVAGTLSGPMKTLQQGLNRGRTDHPGAPTKSEANVLATVRKLLDHLSKDEQDLVLKCAVIWELKVEEPYEPGSLQAIGHLRHVVSDCSHDTARQAWSTLMDVSGRAARLRGGYELAGWLSALHGEGIAITREGSGPAAALEIRRQALEQYKARLVRDGSEIDLRALGAELPPLRLDHADARVKVVDPDDTRSERDLLWAFLRRGRMVLTGLPGGGKSTALRQLAAQICSDATLPLPVRVSLRDIDQFDSNMGFRDRLIAVAVRNERNHDREVLTAEINDRLDNAGDVALLLDSLDETYDRRRTVISEISALVADISPGVSILLATRDVAYGQATTLGWSSLRLHSPSDVERTVTAILEVAAPKTEPTAGRSRWISEREAWVRSALAQDTLLAETPLMPVLLTILAVRREPELLPRRRARILEAIVQDFVAEHELQRGDGQTLGRLEQRESVTASMHAFTSAAAEIQSSQGKASTKSVVEAIAADLREPWGLAPAQARAAGQDAVQLFDESGIFVMSGADETIAPRIALFAEIGDAMQIVSHPDQISEWVTARIASQQFEPLILACTLDACIVNAAAEALSDNPGDTMLARSLVQAAREGVALDVTTTRQVCESLIAHVADGTPDGWRSWEALLQLPIPPELRDSAEAAANQHSPEHAMVARVSLELQFGPMALSEDNIQLLKNVLALPKLPDPPSSDDGHIFDITSWSIDSVLTKTQVKAAEMLLDHDPETAELVAACAIDAPQGPQNTLKQLLADRELSDAVQTIDDANAQSVKGIEIPSWFSDYDDTAYSRVLKLIADHPITELSTSQLTNLDALADFVETLRLNDGGAVHLYKQANEMLQELIELTASLYGFDRLVLASQAAVALERLERWGSAPYWALFDNARECLDVDWRAVNDPEAAARLLMRLFTLGVGHARFAAKSLWEAPISEQAVQTLRDLLPRLARSPAHERFGALALGSLGPGPEPECWVSSKDPVLRAVAAEMIDPMSGDVLSDRFRELLDDPDGHVQEAAIKHVILSPAPNLIAILDEIANRPNPGWMCLSCRTVNPPPGNNSCANDRCHRGGANPAMLATNPI